MSIFGLVLDDTDLKMPIPELPGARKKSNLVKRLRQRYSEVYHRLVVTAKEDVEYERRLREGPNLVSLPATVTKATEIEGLPGVSSPRASSPPRQIRRISPTSTPVKIPASSVEGTDEAPRVSIESTEIEMYTSPLKTRSPQAPLEPEAPLVIPASPVAEAMDDSPFTPKRSRSPPGGIPDMPVEEPVQMEEQVEVAPQPLPQPVQQVPGRRILKANRMRRSDELPTLEEHMDDNMMQMSTPVHPPPRHSLSSYGTTPQSFTNPSPTSFQSAQHSSFQSAPRQSFESAQRSSFQSAPRQSFESVPRSSFGSFSGTSSFQNPSPNPFLQSVQSGSQQSFSNPFQTQAAFGSGQSQSSFRSDPPVFQAQPPPQHQSHEPEQPAFQPTQQPFAPGGVSFSFGQPSTPAPRRSRQGRRKPARNN